MLTLETLIDEAAKVCGSDRALCSKTGLHPSELSDMRAGRKALSPERVGLLADVLQLSAEDARRLAVLAVIDRASPARRVTLRRAFFVSWLLGELFLAGSSYKATERPLTGAIAAPVPIATNYTLCAVGRALIGGLLRAWHAFKTGFSWHAATGLAAQA